MDSSPLLSKQMSTYAAASFSSCYQFIDDPNEYTQNSGIRIVKMQTQIYFTRLVRMTVHFHIVSPGILTTFVLIAETFTRDSWEIFD